MKKILTVLGVVFLALLLIAAGLIGYATYSGTRLDASSKAYVDANVPAIIESWSKEELIRRSSFKLLEAVPDGQLTQLLTKCKELGKLVKYEGSKGESNVSVTTQHGKVVAARYAAKAKFEKSDAVITVILLQEEGVWRIVGFNVNSGLFLK